MVGGGLADEIGVGCTGPLLCSRCDLQVAYETVPGAGEKGAATFILPGQFLRYLRCMLEVKSVRCTDSLSPSQVP